MVQELITQFDTHDRRIFWSLIVTVLVMVALYGYFLSISVYAVVIRKSAEQQVMILSEQVAELESRYTTLDKTIDLALAHTRGFSDIKVPTYLSHEKSTSILSVHTGVRHRGETQ